MVAECDYYMRAKNKQKTTILEMLKKGLEKNACKKKKENCFICNTYYMM